MDLQILKISYIIEFGPISSQTYVSKALTFWCHIWVNGSEAYIEYSNDMDGIYKNIEEYNPNKKG